jgi:hypothetical protein
VGVVKGLLTIWGGNRQVEKLSEASLNPELFIKQSAPVIGFFKEWRIFAIYNLTDGLA